MEVAMSCVRMAGMIRHSEVGEPRRGHTLELLGIKGDSMKEVL